MILLHGTSDAVHVGRELLPPVYTGVQRENWRKKDTDVIFLTQSSRAAVMYAWKAVQRFGGNPVVLTCDTVGMVYQNHNGDFCAFRAKVLSRQPIQSTR